MKITFICSIVKKIAKAIVNFVSISKKQSVIPWENEHPLVIYDQGHQGVFIEVIGVAYKGASPKPDYNGNQRLRYLEQVIAQKQLPVIRFHRTKGVGVDQECLMIGLEIPKTIAKDNFGNPSQQGLADFLGNMFDIPGGSSVSVRRDYGFYRDSLDD